MITELEHLSPDFEYLALRQSGESSADWIDPLVEDDLKHIALLDAEPDAEQKLSTELERGGDAA